MNLKRFVLLLLAIIAVVAVQCDYARSVALKKETTHFKSISTTSKKSCPTEMFFIFQSTEIKTTILLADLIDYLMASCNY